MGVSEFVAGTGILLGLIVMAGLLLRKDGNRQANSLLAAALACNLCYLVLILALHTGLLQQMPGLSLLGFAYVLSSPLLYGYVSVMTQADFHLRPVHLLHLWPLLPIIALPLVSANGADLSSNGLEQARSGWPPGPLALTGLFVYAVSVIYLTASLAKVLAYGQRLADEFSFEESVTLRWLKLLVALCLLMALTGLLVALIRLLPGMELWPRSIYSSLTVIALYYLIAFFGLAQPDVFAGHREGAGSRNDAATASSEDDSADKQARWQQLEAYMVRQKPYLQHELRIADLAEDLRLPAPELSQVINRCSGKNFFDYVSSFRVKRAKELLLSSSGSMADIAQESGFNSQSAFYRQFRKVTGLTPTEFRRQAEQAELSSDTGADSP